MSGISSQPREIPTDNQVASDEAELLKKRKAYHDMEMEIKSRDATHKRETRLQNTIHAVFVIGFWVFGGCFLITAVLFFVHLWLPDESHFMAGDDLELAKDILFSAMKMGIGGIIATLYLSHLK